MPNDLEYAGAISSVRGSLAPGGTSVKDVLADEPSATSGPILSKPITAWPLTARMREPGSTPARQAGPPGSTLPTIGSVIGTPTASTIGNATSANTTFISTPPA